MSHTNLDLSLMDSKRQLTLPFKPFTREDVQNVTLAPNSVIDMLWGTVLPERIGDVGFMPGLDWMQAFAVFVCNRWLHEGSGPQRAVGAAIFVANLGHGEMMQHFDHGLTFPAPTPQGGILVTAPNSPLGRRLNLKSLCDEFKGRLDAVFGQKKVIVATS